MSSQRIRVRVPASTANLGPGFDTIGMAFQLYTTVTVSPAERTSIRMFGRDVEGIPADKKNLIYQVMEKVFVAAGEPMPELAITVENEIPLTRGLGSSAAAIIGALIAANRFLATPFSTEEIYRMATELEGHPDNVGASLFGGIVVATMEEKEVPYIKLLPPEGLRAVVAIPDFPLATEKAREVLPETYPRRDVVHSISHASLLVAALATGRIEWLKKAMQDRIHQPYRASLVPGLERLLREATEYGALGAALSGAGPTLIALVNGEEERLKQFMRDTLEREGITCEVLTLLPDIDGVQVEEHVDITVGS
ncbi:homoserine kinase [Bacillaceae bacterium]